MVEEFTQNKVVLSGLKRVEITQYPLKAIREGFMNAIAHRDYSIFNSNIQVRLFKDHLEIWNPGGLMEGIDIDKLREGNFPSVRRNPVLCKLFDDLGYMEESGHGIKMMKEAMREEGLEPPVLDATRDYFCVSLKGKSFDTTSEHEQKITDLEHVLGERQINGLKYLQSKGQTNIKEYANSMKVSRITAGQDLDLFVKLKLAFTKKIGRDRVYGLNNA
ncbi:MAG: ATP-binding protein [Candidatus Aenigmatarchaeota archaeon]